MPRDKLMAKCLRVARGQGLKRQKRGGKGLKVTGMHLCIPATRELQPDLGSWIEKAVE